MASDRILGLVLLAVALAYIVSALQTQTSLLFDPVGPKAVPVGIGALMALASLFLIAKPDTDPEWPDLKAFGRLGFATLILAAYALTLKSLGFLLPTAIASGVLAYQITPQPMRAVVIGIALSLGLFLLFRYGLGLGLQPLPKAFLG